MKTPYKVAHFSIGCLPNFSPNDLVTDMEPMKIDPLLDYPKSASCHSRLQILGVKSLSPESIPIDVNERMLQMSLHSRYQRYELMSCVPVGILIRTIRDRYFATEI